MTMEVSVDSVLFGREVLAQELSEIDLGKEVPEKLETNSGFIKKNGKEYCRRCNAPVYLIQHNECYCQQPCTYCTNCIQMGKVRRCSKFYHIPEPNLFKQPAEPILNWEGLLSQQQKEASEELIQSIDKNQTRLLWAVAGAGKTEMLFPGIEKAVRQNKRICLASPRIDVCLELAPRIKTAFPTVTLSVLYGDMEESYTYTQLVVATTHQLYRFREAFDVLIIDEMDAFPFRYDDSLQFASDKARKRESSLIYLTATPDRIYQKKIRQNIIHASILPARYHGHPLPVPITITEKKWKERLLKNPTKTKVYKKILELLNLKKKFLLFVPNIKWMEQFEQVLREQIPDKRFEAVHSEDRERKRKVQAMRDRELDFLMTTTILERGVTFENIDVLVIGSDDQIYTESALVQIAGRAGRSKDYPTGEVIYYHDGLTRDIKRAVKQIKQMNRIAKSRGLIKE